MTDPGLRRSGVRAAALKDLDDLDRIAARIDRARKRLKTEVEAFEASEKKLFARVREYPEIHLALRGVTYLGRFRSVREPLTAELVADRVVLPHMDLAAACAVMAHRGQLEWAKGRSTIARRQIDRLLPVAAGADASEE